MLGGAAGFLPMLPSTNNARASSRATLNVRRQYEMLPYTNSAHTSNLLSALLASLCALLSLFSALFCRCCSSLISHAAGVMSLPRAYLLGADPFLYHPARLRPNHFLPRHSLFDVACLFHSLPLSAYGIHASCSTSLSALVPLTSYASTLYSLAPTPLTLNSLPSDHPAAPLSHPTPKFSLRSAHQAILAASTPLHPLPHVP